MTVITHRSEGLTNKGTGEDVRLECGLESWAALGEKRKTCARRLAHPKAQRQAVPVPYFRAF